MRYLALLLTALLGSAHAEQTFLTPSGGGAGSITVTDGTHSVSGATTLTFGNGYLVSGTSPSATVNSAIADTVHTTSVTTANIGGQDDYNGSSLTATLAALSTAGQTLFVTNQNASGLTISNNSQAVAGLPLSTTLHTGGFYGYTYSGSQINAFGFPGFGTITTGALMKFVDGTGAATAASAADLPATTLATGTSVSLIAPREYYVCTSTCTVTPPVPAAGYEFCVMNDDNVSTVITLAALGSSARYENTARTAYGTAGTGTFVSGGAVGDKVCIVGRDSTHYLTLSFMGTWTAN